MTEFKTSRFDGRELAKVTAPGSALTRCLTCLPRWLPFAFLVALLPCYWVSIHAKGAGVFHDDGIYLVTAKALAQGDGYKIISLPNRIAQTKYPILFPAILALVWRIFPTFPDNLPLLKMVPACAAIAWLFVTYRFARSAAGVSRAAAAWILFFTAATQWAQFLATTIMSETLFALLAMSALFALSSVVNAKEDRWPELIASALLAGAAYQTRSAGFALMLAGLGSLVVARKFKEALGFASICALPLIAWSQWQHHTLPSATSVEAYYTAQSYRDFSLLAAHLPVTQTVSVAILNLFYLSLYPYQVFSPPYSSLLHSTLMPLLAAPFWVFVVRGVRRSPDLRASSILVSIYLAMLVVYIWEPSRFMMPLLPILLIFLCRGLPNRFPKAIAPLLAVGPLLTAVFFAMNTSAHQVTCFAQMPWDKRSEGSIEPSNWASLSRLQTWAKENTSPESVFLAEYDPAFYLYTGRKAIRPVALDSMGLFYVPNRTVATKKREFEAVIDHTQASYLAETGHEKWEDPDFPKIVEALQKEGRIHVLKEFGAKYRIYEISPSAKAVTTAELMLKDRIP